MSFLLRRHWPLARAGWRDLDAEHARPDENPIKPPWKRTNMARSVWLQGNELRIADYSETVFQVGGVSYEQMAFTPNWGCEFDLNIDGNIIQRQFWGGVISPSWTKVGFSDILNQACIVVHRDVTSAVNQIQILVFRNLSTIDTLVATQNYSGLMNRSWWRMTILISRDRLVRVYYNGTMLLQYWLPSDLAAGPGRRAMNFLNQTSATSWQRNFHLFDTAPLYPVISWALAFADDFNRPNGAVGNGWTQLGVNAGLVNQSWSTTGTTDGSRGLIRDTGITSGYQRVEAVVGGNIGPNNASDSSIVLRATADGTSGLVANFYSNSVWIARLTGSLTDPTFLDYTHTGEIAITTGTPVAFSCSPTAAWVEVDGQVVLAADLNGQVPVTNSWAGLRVEREPLLDSASWDEVRVYTAA